MRALVSKFETLGVYFNAEQQVVNCCPHTINLSAQSILKYLKAEGKEKEEEFSILQEDESDSAGHSVGDIVMKVSHVYEIETSYMRHELTQFLHKQLRKFVITIRRSTKKADLFRQTCNTLDLEPQTLVIDVKTRWHSTYEMIECALSMKRAIVKFWSDTEVEGDVPFRKYKLSNDEWIILDKLKSILQV
ncbi:hypothetical protein BKA69DRAFT_474748 [Paraphysoderma sedebokerense]|nr:hypothetical protein BKA69DRAFT_474748 [Paraphysoderma sedebokerense]